MKMLYALLGSTALLAGPALAQNTQDRTADQARPGMTGQQQNDRQGSPEQVRTEDALSPNVFARWAAMGNQLQIETSRLALERSQRPDVDRFAQRIIDDHTRIAQDLRNAARGLSVPSELNSAHRSLLDDLRQTQQNFDEEYVSFQIEAHQDLIDVFEEFADAGEHPQLQRFAEEAIPSLQRHLRRAQDLEQQITRQAGDRTSGQQSRADGSRDMSANARQNTRSAAMSGQDGEREGMGQRPGQPQIVVRQDAPNVSVQQGRPQITVRQGPPRITVEQPQPEIIVRMPEPNVDVTRSRPQVTVRLPEPRVSVEQRGQENVTVSRSEQEPQVRFERTGEPQVVVRQAQGQPRVRYERMEDQATGSTNNARMNESRMNDQARNAGADSDRSWVEEAEGRLGDQRAGLGAGEATRQNMQVSRLVSQAIYNARGEQLGEIEQVLLDPTDDRRFVLLSSGGFLGLFEDRVALPVERLRLEGERLVVRGLTRNEIEEMPNWRNRIPNRRTLRGDETVSVTGQRAG